MPVDLSPLFATLRPVLAGYSDNLTVQADSPTEYTLVSRSPSPLQKDKKEPLYFGSVRLGKGYVSYHLMPLYTCAELNGEVSPALKKRMQGKTCFNFKKQPEPELLKDLKRLTDAAFEQWAMRKTL